MSTISDYLAPDHLRCDALFADAESAAAKGDWLDAGTQFARFHEALLHHFAMEEEIMFPAFETATGMNMGPTEVMRSEHRQMRDILEQMAHALERGEGDAFLGDAETLLIIMQQHNMKEEQMLYRMADQVLGGTRSEIVERMRAMG